MLYVYTWGVGVLHRFPDTYRRLLLQAVAGAVLLVIGGACLPAGRPSFAPATAPVPPSISMRSGFLLSLQDPDRPLRDMVLPGVYLPVHSGEDLEALVRTVTDIESGGNPRMVGQAGERGLMQIMRPTWREISHRVYGKSLAFEKAFDPDINQAIGAAYLEELAATIHHQTGLIGPQLIALTLAGYNGGPGALQRAGFRMDRLPRGVHSYATRGLALYEVYRDDPLQLAKQ